MKLLTLLLVALLPQLATADVTHRSPQPEVSAITIADGAINRLCPIGKEAIDGKTFATYDGHQIGFCCGGCDRKFLAWSKADKDAFVAASLAEPKEAPPVAAPSALEAVGDPYTLATCPVSGEPLGSMGDPIDLVVDGRAVKLCCSGCARRMKSEPAKYFASVDKQLIAEQKPYYPLTTCIISGDPLVETGEDAAQDVIVGNRLFRVCCDGCVPKLKRDAVKHLVTLDAAVRKAQAADYPLSTCLVLEESKLGAMGDPVEIVVGNRLVKFCCKGCQPKFEKEPVAFLARLDAAWAPIHQRAAKATGVEK